MTVQSHQAAVQMLADGSNEITRLLQENFKLRTRVMELEKMLSTRESQPSILSELECTS